MYRDRRRSGHGRRHTARSRHLRFSVIRTGIGDLIFAAAGDIRMNSLYGVYTAGTASSVDPAYICARAPLADGTLIGALPPELDYSTALASYRAWYPDHAAMC